MEKRCITVSQALNDYPDLAWPYLRQVFKLERTFTELANGKKTHEVSYGITGLSAKRATPKRVLYCVRRYWGIENGLHDCRDVTFPEDRLRIGNVAGQAMAAVNHLVISLFNHLGYKNHAQARREFDACPYQALALLCGL